MSSHALCQPFIRSGTIATDSGPIHFCRGLLDTGAQGSNFISREMYERLPTSITDLSRSIDRIVRLGDARSLSVQLEIPLTISILDSIDNNHQHSLWYSVLDVLSHDIIIGLVDLIGPFYDLFADSVATSRQLAITNDLGTDLTNLTTEIQSLCIRRYPADIVKAKHTLRQHSFQYLQRKKILCSSASTSLQLLALQDGTTTEILVHPQHGHVFADSRVETRYDTLAALLCSPDLGEILHPWSKPVDTLAPEEANTPDPPIFQMTSCYI